MRKGIAMEKKKKRLSDKEARVKQARQGGRACLRQYGKEFYREIALKRYRDKNKK